MTSAAVTSVAATSVAVTSVVATSVVAEAVDVSLDDEPHDASSSTNGTLRGRRTDGSSWPWEVVLAS